MTRDDLATPDAATLDAKWAVWRTWTGWVLTFVGVVLLAVVVEAHLASETRNLSVAVEDPTALARTTFLFGPLAAICGIPARLLLRAPGPWRDGEVGVALGSGSVVVVALLGVLEPAAWLFAWAATLPVLVVVSEWWSAAIVCVVVAGVVLTRRGRQRRGGREGPSRCGPCVLGVAYVTFGVLVLLAVGALLSLDGFFGPAA